MPETSKPTDASKAAEQERTDDLVRRAQKGDARAFDDLVRMYQTRIYNLAYRMVSHREDAADLTQEIFVKLYRSLDKFQGRSKFSTWLYSLAANTCRSGLRKRRRVREAEVIRLDAEREEEEGATSYELADPGETPDRETVSRDTMKQIQQFISDLKEDFRMVIVLRDVRGLAYEEIAEVLDCSVGTVKSRLARARLRLQDKLTREGLTCAVKK